MKTNYKPGDFWLSAVCGFSKFGLFVVFGCLEGVEGVVPKSFVLGVTLCSVDFVLAVVLVLLEEVADLVGADCDVVMDWVLEDEGGDEVISVFSSTKI